MDTLPIQEALNSPSTVELVFDVVGIMIPVVTGFLVLFGGSVGKIWERAQQPNADIKVAWGFAVLVVILEPGSIGFFAGAMALGIKYSTGTVQSFLFSIDLCPGEALSLARKFVAFGYALFVIGIFAAMLFYRYSGFDKMFA